MNIKKAIEKIFLKENLTSNEMSDVINEIMSGKATSAQKAGFLVALKSKGETSEELVGAIKALKKYTLKINIKDRKHLIDTCGTGGDGGKTFNISTAVAIVAASGGAKVAKHGNRAISSKSGSLDVLNELGIKTNYSKEESEKFINEKGLSFLLATTYNSGMKNVGQERIELGIRTIFNMLGPLLNPADITGQLMGVYDVSLMKTIGNALLELGLDRAMIVYGNDGLDEITNTTTTDVCEIKDGKLNRYVLDPLKYGFSKANIKDIQGGTPKENAEIILKILNGEKGYRRDIVVLNSGAALYVAKIVDSLDEGINMAKDLIDSGKAYKKYKELQEL
ncbi:anthranilate phosphoribosyltransferase [Clostridium aquiflavi]|uniref:Anthranilate phosphoribosyltransferase n=1 Tax=Clostridium aquiflavi TaxID=3073603 RepID=A0ABU1EKE6_9CLOT|nr:anthranilate phosphoribosyltransferase [Clostridium sp. 5N-1]MDR5588718.1 anthranilate phosphoribosyltransferase [Clostridium sp. 5N-1]